MKLIKKVIICIAIVFLISACNSSSSNIIDISSDDLKQKINNKETFILYIGNDNCSHCISYKPVLESVLKKYKIKIYHLDNTKYEINDFNIEGTPTVLFVEKGEEETTLNRINGEISKEKTIEILKENGYIK